jgi:hypothetical protein
MRYIRIRRTAAAVYMWTASMREAVVLVKVIFRPVGRRRWDLRGAPAPRIAVP